MIGRKNSRISKLEEVNEVMEGTHAIPKYVEETLSQEEVKAIDLGVHVGITSALLVMHGKCDEMSPFEAASRAYAAAFNLYVKTVVDDEQESEAEHEEEQ